MDSGKQDCREVCAGDAVEEVTGGPAIEPAVSEGGGKAPVAAKDKPPRGKKGMPKKQQSNAQIKDGDGLASPRKGKKKQPKLVRAMSERKDTTFQIDKMSDFPAWYEQIMRVADIVDNRYPVKGMMVFKPYGCFMQNQIMLFLENEWDRQGIERCMFPLLIPQEYLAKEKDHIAGFEEECFWVTHGGSKPLESKLALRPTSETAMYSMFAMWVRSFRDLPLKVHQTCSVYRHETKDTRPLIRVREIPWNEAHTCHATAEEALENLEEAWRSYGRLLEDQLGIFGLRLRRPAWDKFAGAEHSDVLDAVMPCGRVLQSVGAHYLGQKFSTVFEIRYLDKDNSFKNPYMTCYGVSTRMLAAALSAHGDKKGLVLPPLIAKYQVVIVTIGKPDADVTQAAEALCAKLRDSGKMRVFLDNAEKPAGEKFYFWEMKGVPLRVELGPRDIKAGEFRLVLRDTGEKMQVKLCEAEDSLLNQLNQLRARLCAKAKAAADISVASCGTIEEVEAAILKGGFARIPYHSMALDGKDGEEMLREKFHAEIRGYISTEEPPADGTRCLLTGEPAKFWAYVARSY